MTPDVVVDIGNTRTKFGLCDEDRISVIASPPLECGNARSIVEQFGIPGRVNWAVAGVHPERMGEFMAWALSRGDDVALLDDYRRLPLNVAVEYPEHVGIDRLLGAVAVNRHRKPRTAAVFVDAGSAITVNLVDAEGTFRGGSIAPGIALMSRALNSFTAKLPLLPSEQLLANPPPFPAVNTSDAIHCGILAAALGGVRTLLSQLHGCELFITGGDAEILCGGLAELKPIHVLSLTLEGIRIAAEGLP